MELLETQDPEKRKLLETSERHKRELEKEVSEITSKTERMMTNALIIGGALALSYLVVSQLTKRKSKNSKSKKAKKAAVVTQDDDEDEELNDSEPGFLSVVGTKVVNQASIILMDIAREKLMEYLQSRKKDDDAS